ncbi:MAG TPA: 30S ribosome-binding factor RbfA [Spirochaetota bacterium]|jgi:ribosome-binding factor A|nr:30S ribosome-binding factor RbfA [Spirochaetota bacterium]OPZ39622.1 MAG: Ribosome-binding factor A [Spirochaetes bacterium ADurb.BinA120]HNU92726.1 30S ribosome-binding factor RbfA [Spirochaetota bacterium]HPI13073.1 30S ribosome-binding factor RbfA [Spirochaetota bacterium]HPO46101.1 30S ribosome-binding factor RbfA [Spirochaetota bacterium]
MTTHRRERLEELIKRVVADALLSEIKDPRIGFVSVVRVKLARDYSVADVFVSVLGDDTAKRKSMAGLESARSYVQFLVGKGIQLRTTPRLVFHLDTSVEEGVRMVQVIEKLEAGSGGGDAGGGEGEPGGNGG